MKRQNLQELAMELKLTNLQVVALNGIADGISIAAHDYFSYEDTLSDAEDKYLRGWLLNKGIIILKKEGVMLRGATARKWLEEHGEEEG